MKYLALLSGGKDSCFNLLHCAKNGHELVAAASLGPGPGKEELDSYLYQTVGQDAIELVSQALEVPLYRRVITGNAIEQGSEYGSRKSKGVSAIEGDETEDLMALLSEVKARAHHPNVLGVSVGAILSNYQRVRVEHVCRRLGLTPLCYLWNRDQGELFDEMISAGMEAVLIKVAGIGLTTKHLGRSLSEMQPTLVKLNQQYGAHICGEGGEYESLTLDCPLFKHRIIRSEVETVIHSDSSFATVAFLRVKKAHLEAKPPCQDFDLTIPELLGDPFVRMHDAVEQATPTQCEDSGPPRSNDDLGVTVGEGRKVGSWISISNIERTVEDPIVSLSIEEEVTLCFRLLETRLNQSGLDISNCTNINVLLSDIDLFARVNAVYATFFGSSPPARACVSVDLPHPIRVRLDCVAFDEKQPNDRQALHVQGLSYWAPANIGPYSQAITAGERIFISGQIGLIPPQLALPSPLSLATETALACQHVSRVTDVLRSTSGLGWTGHTQLALYWFADTSNLLRVKSVIRASTEVPRTPNLYLAVKALPKDALIEKQALIHTGRCAIFDEDEGNIMQLKEPACEKRAVYVTSRFHNSNFFVAERTDFADGAVLEWEISYCSGDDDFAACTLIYIKGGSAQYLSSVTVQPLIVPTGNSSLSDAIRNGQLLPSTLTKRNLSTRLFYIPSRVASYRKIVQDIFGNEKLPPTTPIPCRFIATDDFNGWDYVLCIIQS
ncbi:hypothetical protein H0H92_014484 [Tricholoma furcatifolium]|nr:hypothetical protein H0H92_014484 [Tricholoma furcatifolium]